MSKRDLQVDIIRVILVVSVLVIHTFNHCVFLSGFDIQKVQALYYTERFFRFAVPLFFIVSGYTLALSHQKTTELREYVWKRIKRLLVPYSIWSIIYSLFALRLEGNSLSLQNFLTSLLYGNSAIHLYFIPALFILNLAFPFIVRMKKYLTTHCMVVLLVIGALLQAIDFYHVGLPVITPIRIALLNLTLFILGMYSYFHKNKIKILTARYKYWLLAGVIATYLLLVQHTEYLFLTFHKVDFINSQWQPIIFGYSILIWLLLQSLTFKQINKFSPFIIVMSKLTLFVYYVHILFISIFWRLWGSYLLSTTSGKVLETWWFAPLSFVFVVALSFATAYVVYFIPKLNAILGIEK